MIVTCRECKVSYHLDDSLINEKGSNVRCSNCKHIFKVFPAKISKNEDNPIAGLAASSFAQIPAQRPEGNANTNDSYEGPAGDFCEPIGEEELNYIEEKAATIIAGRGIYSWNTDLEDLPEEDTEERLQITSEYFRRQGEKADRFESEIDPEEDFGPDLATEPFDALLQLLGLDERGDSNLPEGAENGDSESQRDQDFWLYEPFPHSQEYDWRDFEYEPDDFDEKVSREGALDVDSDTVARSERAIQIAVELGGCYGWGREGINLLAGILEENGWSATKSSLERELQSGLTPEELEVAAAIREIWKEYPEFSTGRSYWGNHGDKSSSFTHRYLHLSWPAALALVHCFESYPGPAEIEELFLELYQRWISNLSSQPHFSSFYSYLRYHFGLVPGSLDMMPGLVFKEENSFSNEIYPGYSESRALSNYLNTLSF